MNSCKSFVCLWDPIRTRVLDSYKYYFNNIYFLVYPAVVVC
jgi:hypothetical protein